MKDECIELLSKLEKCINDPDFQLLIIMKFMRSLTPYFQNKINKGEKDE